MKLHAVWKYWCFITFMKLISKVGIIPFNISFQSTEVGWWDLNKSNGIFFFQCEPAELPQSKMSWETWLWTRETRRGNAFILLHLLEIRIFLFVAIMLKDDRIFPEDLITWRHDIYTFIVCCKVVQFYYWLGTCNFFSTFNVS